MNPVIGIFYHALGGFAAGSFYIPFKKVSNWAWEVYTQMPGIDILMNEWGTGPDAQFGNARSVKEIRSAANQIGQKRTMSETYGAGGWDMTLFDQKIIGTYRQMGAMLLGRTEGHQDECLLPIQVKEVGRRQVIPHANGHKASPSKIDTVMSS